MPFFVPISMIEITGNGCVCLWFRIQLYSKYRLKDLCKQNWCTTFAMTIAKIGFGVASRTPLWTFVLLYNFQKKQNPRKGKRACPVVITRHALLILSDFVYWWQYGEITVLHFSSKKWQNSNLRLCLQGYFCIQKTTWVNKQVKQW